MSKAHPNIGSKRHREGAQSEDQVTDQYTTIANLQTKLAQTEKAVRNLAAPLSKANESTLPGSIPVDPLVYLEVEQTRQEHDDLVRENEKLKQQSQPHNKQISDLMESNKKLRSDLLTLQAQHRTLELKLQNAEELIEVIKQDAVASKQQCATLSEENNNLSSQVFVLEHMQTIAQTTIQSISDPSEEQRQQDLASFSAFLQQAAAAEQTSDLPPVASDNHVIEHLVEQSPENQAPSPRIETDEQDYVPSPVLQADDD